MADQMGRSGITGDVDMRYSERYGVALLFSILNAATAYQVPVKSEGQAIIVESFGREMSTLGNTILNEHINIKPVVKIPAGTRILISPSKDIWFREPVRKEAQIVAFANGGNE